MKTCLICGEETENSNDICSVNCRGKQLQKQFDLLEGIVDNIIELESIGFKAPHEFYNRASKYKSEVFSELEEFGENGGLA